MTPPTWLDAQGRPMPTVPCFTCGREQEAGTYPGQVIRLGGWQPLETTTSVGRCGHPQERLPWLIGGDRWRLIPEGTRSGTGFGLSLWTPDRDHRGRHDPRTSVTRRQRCQDFG